MGLAQRYCARLFSPPAKVVLSWWASAIKMTIFSLLAIAFITIGGGITVLFWVPGIINRARLREVLGQRYPLIFIVYVANGPLLVFLGLFLLLRF